MAFPPPTVLPTSTVGSHGLPGWVWLAREAMEAGRLGAPERFRDWPAHLELGAGVIDVKANPDCGFWETPRWVAKLKLAALVEGAARVRKELAG